MNTTNLYDLKEITGKYCLNGEPYTGICNTNYRTYYYKNGELHRDNGLPAVELANGDKAWWVNGKCHRDNGLPAIEGEDGTKQWWVNGHLHRDDGLPAIEYADGDKEWWINGKRIYSWEQYQKTTKCSKEQLVMYKLTHGHIEVIKHA